MQSIIRILKALQNLIITYYKKIYLFHEAIKKKNLIFHLKEDLTNRKPAQYQSHTVIQQPETGKNALNQQACPQCACAIPAKVTGSYIHRLKAGQTLKLSQQSIKMCMHIYVSIHINVHRMSFWEHSITIFKIASYHEHTVLLKQSRGKLLGTIIFFLKIVALVGTHSQKVCKNMHVKTL